MSSIKRSAKPNHHKGDQLIALLRQRRRLRSHHTGSPNGSLERQRGGVQSGFWPMYTATQVMAMATASPVVTTLPPPSGLRRPPSSGYAAASSTARMFRWQCRLPYTTAPPADVDAVHQRRVSALAVAAPEESPLPPGLPSMVLTPAGAAPAAAPAEVDAAASAAPAAAGPDAALQAPSPLTPSANFGAAIAASDVAYSPVASSSSTNNGTDNGAGSSTSSAGLASGSSSNFSREAPSPRAAAASNGRGQGRGRGSGRGAGVRGPGRSGYAGRDDRLSQPVASQRTLGSDGTVAATAASTFAGAGVAPPLHRDGSERRGLPKGGRQAAAPQLRPAPAADGGLLEELQAMRRQVSELTALLAEQQRRDAEQRQQLNALLLSVLNGTADATALAGLVQAAAGVGAAAGEGRVPASASAGSSATAAKATPIAAAAAADVTRATPQWPVAGQQPATLELTQDMAAPPAVTVTTAAAVAAEVAADGPETPAAVVGDAGVAAEHDSSSTGGAQMQQPSATSGRHSCNPRGLEAGAGVPPEVIAPVAAPAALVGANSSVGGNTGDSSSAGGSSGSSSETSIGNSEIAFGKSTGSSSNKSSSNSNSTGLGSGGGFGGQFMELELAVPVTLQPELLALLEQELYGGSSDVGASVNGSSVTSDASCISITNGYGSRTSSSGSFGTAQKAPPNAVLPYSDGCELTHGSPDVQPALSTAELSQWKAAAGGDCQQPATATSSTSTASPNVNSTSSFESAVLGPSASGSAAAVPPPPQESPPATRRPAEAAAASAPPGAAAFPLAEAVERMHAEGGAKQGTTSLGAGAAAPAGGASDSGASDRGSSSAVSDTPSSISSRNVSSGGGTDAGGDAGAAAAAAAAAGAAATVASADGEFRELVAQLAAVASETVRLTRAAQVAGLTLPPDLVQPAVLPAAVALLERVGAARASAGTSVSPAAPAARDAAARGRVAGDGAPLSQGSAAASAPRSSTSGSSFNGSGVRPWPQRSSGRGGGLSAAVSAAGRGGRSGLAAGAAGRVSSRPPVDQAPQVAASTAAPPSLTPEQMEALRAHPSHMFQGLRRLSWEGEEPLAQRPAPREKAAGPAQLLAPAPPRPARPAPGGRG